MSTNHPRRSAPLFLALSSLVMLCLVATILHQQQLQTLQKMYQDAALVRGQTIANDTAQKIGHAISLGIPLSKLIGVDAMLDALQQQHADLVAIDIQDPLSLPIWSSRSAPSEDASVQAAAVVQAHHNRETAAVVNVYIHPQQAGELLAHNLWIWVSLLALLTALSYWAAKLSYSLRPWLREDVIANISRNIHSGIFQNSWLVPHSAAHDTRPEQLSADVRSVHEAKDRLQRLVHSLRQTEPSAHHRQQLDSILAQATKGLTLSTGLERQRIYAIEQQCFWLSLILALSSTSPWIWQTMLADRADSLSIQASSAYFVSLLLAYKLGQHIKLPVMQVLTTGFLALLFAPFLLAQSNAGVVIQATISGVVAGLSYPSFQSVLHAARRKFIFAQPRLSRPLERAYLYALASLGPILAMLTVHSFSDDIARIALLLPAACGLMACLLWNSHASPWRTRIRPTKYRRPKSTYWAVSFFYIAIGLGIAALTTNVNHNAADHACWLIAGWCSGYFLRSSTHKVLRLSLAVLQLAAGSLALIWPSEITIMLVVYMLAFGAGGAHAQLRASRTPVAIGAGLCTGLIMSYFFAPSIVLSLSAIVLGASWILSLKPSRQGTSHAN